MIERHKMTKQECLRILEALNDNAEVTLIVGKCQLWQLPEYSPNLWKTPQWQQPHTYDPLNPYKVTCETKTS